MKTTKTSHVPGLDLLRAIAIVLVTWQHTASVLGAYAETNWHNISPGQSAVAIFCAIAGFLAFRDAQVDPLQWLKRRLLRIYPAYWIATLGAFALAVKFSSKPITLGLFVSQMLGTGFFTHGWDLINVVSWFVSLILLCYVLAAVALWLRRPLVLMLLFAALALASIVFVFEVDLSRHILAFCLGAVCGLTARPVTGFLLAILLLIAGLSMNVQLCYAGIGLLLLNFCGIVLIREPAWVRLVSKYSYEYFLVHGIFLAGMVQVLGPHAWVIVVALALACVAAVVLKHLQQPLTSWIEPRLLAVPNAVKT
ncbi:MAG TPA: acyltransferase family protein [Rhodocyclaceae bacterium]|nr:acyltransferase family protein [Rhodocyclaceae bacterium]